MYVAHRLDLRDKAEQIGDHFGTSTDYEGRVAKFVDEHRMVKRTGITAIPKILQVHENLLVVLLGARRNLQGHTSIIPEFAPAHDVSEMRCCGYEAEPFGAGGMPALTQPGPAAPLLRYLGTRERGIGRRRRKRGSALCHIRWGRAGEKVLTHRREEIDRL